MSEKHRTSLDILADNYEKLKKQYCDFARYSCGVLCGTHIMSKETGKIYKIKRFNLQYNVQNRLAVEIVVVLEELNKFFFPRKEFLLENMVEMIKNGKLEMIQEKEIEANKKHEKQII